MSSYRYKSYNRNNIRELPQVKYLSKEKYKEIEMLSLVFPFKINNYLADELINWENYETDPIFNLVFPNKNMLNNSLYDKLNYDFNNASEQTLKNTILDIWYKLNPHPAGQLDLNVALLNKRQIHGLQHKYNETVLAFPSAGQTCHAYCSFCFRWPQFIGVQDFKINLRQSNSLLKYLQHHPEVTDLLITGGDPMVMNSKSLENYLSELIENIETTNIQTIRIGTKSLSYFPYKYTTDKDAKAILNYFEKIISKGLNLSIMAHINSPNEQKTPVFAEAVRLIRSTGAQIRSQAPILKHINDSAEDWAEMWRQQVNLNIIPYYMFIPRDTGAKEYFEISLIEAWKIFSNAFRQVSGICKTARGPIMSALPGKIQVLGVSQLEKDGEMKDALALRFIQGRNPEWNNIPFYAELNENANWLTELKPFYGDKFFYEDNLMQIIGKKKHLLKQANESIEEISDHLEDTV